MRMAVHYPCGVCRWIPLFLALASASAEGGERLPEKPRRFFNDYTGAVNPGMADRLNERLAQFERESSNQLLVVIYSRMLTDSSIEDYCARTFERWGPGRADRDNGAVLFVFRKQRKMRIQTGYGLEASLTDAECLRIIDDLKPYFRAGDYTGGSNFAVSAMIAATTGEYQGTGRTLAEKQSDPQVWMMIVLFGFVSAVILFQVYQARQSAYVYDGKRRYRLPGGGWSHSGYGSGGGWSGGGGGRSGGGSWSGGGGSTGGGGASGGW